LYTLFDAFYVLGVIFYFFKVLFRRFISFCCNKRK